MALYGILDFDTKDPHSVEQWALWHYADHIEIKQAIQTALSKNLTVWELYPLDMKLWERWAIKHQAAHDEMNTASGLQSNDLSQAKLDDPQAMATWNYNHFREHQAQRVKYGI